MGRKERRAKARKAKHGIKKSLSKKKASLGALVSLSILAIMFFLVTIFLR